MADKQVDLLRRDECQPLTQAQIADIKAQTVTRPKANVNIMPYHVYSPNEHVVGEWQEMVDGVLKKKTVYEKTVIFSSAKNVSANNWNVIDTLTNGQNLIEISLYRDSGAGNQIGVLVIPREAYFDGENVSIIPNANANSIYGYKVCYTKTTDEWEVV